MCTKHELITWWTGPKDQYASGQCTCGAWHFRGTTPKLKVVRKAHKEHVKSAVKAPARKHVSVREV